MTALRIGIVALLVAGAMLVTELTWRPIFTVRFGEMNLRLWILVAIYGGLQLAVAFTTLRKLELTADEVERWGPKLEEVTPTVVERLQARVPVAQIADEIEDAAGIPTDVTLRYIIALGQHVGSR